MIEETGMGRQGSREPREDMGTRAGPEEGAQAASEQQGRKPRPPEGWPQLSSGTLWALVDVPKGNEYMWH